MFLQTFLFFQILINPYIIKDRSTRFTPVFTRQTKKEREKNDFFQVRPLIVAVEQLMKYNFFLNNTAKIIILQAECACIK